MKLLKSFIEVAEDSDFSIYNIPFGIYQNENTPYAGATAIGDFVVDLSVLHDQGYFEEFDLPKGIFRSQVLNPFIALGKPVTNKVRIKIQELLLEESPLQGDISTRSQAFIPSKNVTMLMPVKVENYTDFYSSIEHATNVGTMFRDPENALLPNWKHLPVGYHGRASSIIPSGVPIHRPKGQTKDPKKELPEFGPTKRLDFELELAFITGKETDLGSTVSTEQAEEHIFGFVLFNDWSARDVQVWEYVPLGPFLAKNFASSVSPWIVTLEALQPYRTSSPKQDPEVLPYLRSSGDKNFDINLEVYIQPDNRNPHQVSQSNFKYMYWNICQQLAHQTINGCNLKVGDLYASGTISGPTPDSYGSMLELAWKGTKPLQFPDGITRKFIEDGDTVIIKGHSEKLGKRVGFGEVKTMVLPAT
ncbi:MAG: fumarylacetoacetase [Cyclobacteriaceae bacterium]